LPCVYGFLAAKNAGRYLSFFEAIRDRVPQFNPEFLMTDFELAAMHTIKDVFPALRTTACLFHLSQSLHRKMMDIASLREILNQPDEEDEGNGDSEKRRLKSFAALSFVPPAEVYIYFCILSGTFAPTADMRSN
jgi:hypothetical protein